MPISLDNIFGIHEHAISVRSQRAEVLAANLSNADTPNFKARDIDFSEALEAAQGASKGADLVTTDDQHMHGLKDVPELALTIRYPAPFQPALDGNTVDTAIEQAKFLDNAMRYQASLTFLNSRIRSLLTAIREE